MCFSMCSRNMILYWSDGCEWWKIQSTTERRSSKGLDQWQANDGNRHYGGINQNPGQITHQGTWTQQKNQKKEDFMLRKTVRYTIKKSTLVSELEQQRNSRNWGGKHKPRKNNRGRNQNQPPRSRHRKRRIVNRKFNKPKWKGKTSHQGKNGRPHICRQGKREKGHNWSSHKTINRNRPRGEQSNQSRSKGWKQNQPRILKDTRRRDNPSFLQKMSGNRMLLKKQAPQTRQPTTPRGKKPKGNQTQRPRIPSTTQSKPKVGNSVL